MLPIVTLTLLATSAVAPVKETTPPLTPTPNIANFLPTDTPLIGLVSTRGETWATLNRFQLFHSTFTAISRFLPHNFKFDYTRDVESWLGDQVTFAFMPKNGATQATIDTNFLIVVPVKNDSRLQPFLYQLKKNGGSQIQREYKGVTIWELKTLEPSPGKPNRPSSQPPQTKITLKPQPPIPNSTQPYRLKKQSSLAIATLPGYLITANTAKPIEQLIDTAQGKGETLAQNPWFQKTLQHSQTGQILFSLYENPKNFLSLLQDISKDPNLPFPILSLDKVSSDQLKDYSSIDGFVAVQPEGLSFQINGYRQVPKIDKISVPTGETQKILALMPAATYSAATGHNLNQELQKIISAIKAKPSMKGKLGTFSNLATTGLSVLQDYTSWMDGEYAFFLFPTKGGLFRLISVKSNLGIGLAVQTTNRTAADAALKKLENLIKSSSAGTVAINTRSIKGTSITSWEFHGNPYQSLFAYSWLNSNTVIFTTGFGAIADLVPQPRFILPQTYNFTTATNSLPQGNQGYFYLNMGSFLSWLYGFVPPQINNNQYFRVFKQVVGSIYSVSTTSYTTPDREGLEGLVVLAPVRKPL